MKKAFLALAIVAMVCGHASATIWWDPTNGATAGTGSATPSGTWANGTAAWTTSSAGTGATINTYTAAADTTVRFAAGTDATGSYTVTVSGTVNANQIGIEEGNITFTGGTINFTHAAAGTSILTGITGGAASTTTTLQSKLTGTGGFKIARSTVAGTQEAVLANPTANDNTLTGGYQANLGQTIRLGANDQIGDTNLVTVVSGATFDVNGKTDTVASVSGTGTSPVMTLGAGALTLAAPAGETFTGVISGAGGSITKNGAGTWTLTGANTYTGGTTIGAGTLEIGNGGTTGATAAAGLITNNGTLRYNRSDTATVTQSGAISGTGQIVKDGAHTIALTSASNSYSGNTTINSGAININSTSVLGNAVGTLKMAGGKLNATASRTPSTAPVANPINVTADSEITTTSAASAVDLNLSNDSVVGTAGKKLTFRNDGADAAGDVFQPRFSGSGFDFAADIAIANGATGKTQLNSYNGTATIQTFSGTISGNGSYIRNASTATGGGTTIFKGANTYSGGTTVDRGTLLANNTSGSATGSGDVTVNANGKLGGTGTISGNVILAGGTLAPGASVGTLNIGGNLTLTSGTFEWEFNSTALTADLDNVSGALSIASAVSLFIAPDFGASFLTAGTKFTVISYGSGAPPGTFNGLVENAELTMGGKKWRIKYADSAGLNGGAFPTAGHNVTLTAIPEASSFITIGLGGIFAIGAVWLGKRYGIAIKI